MIQKVRQNKQGLEAIQETVDAIIDVVSTYKQHDSQGAPDEPVAGPSRVTDFSTYVISSCFIGLLTCLIQCHGSSQG
jgi:hypothetical protein